MERWTGVPWEGKAATAGGYVTEVLGHIPTVGERTTIDGVSVEVERMEGRAVVSLLVTPVTPQEEED